MTPACFFKRAQCAESHGIVHRRDESAFGRRSPQELPYCIQTVIKLAFTIQVHNRTHFHSWQYLIQAGQSASYSQLRQRSCDRQLEKKQRLHVPVPILLRPTAQRSAADHSGAIIVGAKKDGARVWDFDGNDRNVRLEELRRDDRRNMLVCLKFEYETDALVDQQVGIV